MLTLTCKEGEALCLLIDDLKIRVVLQETRRASGKISIDAPKEVLILREDLLELKADAQ